MGLKTLLDHFQSKPADFEVRLGIEDAANIPLVAGAFEVEWSFRRRRTLGVQAEDEEGKGRSILDSSQAGHPQEDDRKSSNRSHNIFRRRSKPKAKSDELERTNTTASSTSSSSTLHNNGIQAIDHAQFQPNRSSTSHRLHTSSSSSSLDSRSSSSSASTTPSFRTADSSFHDQAHDQQSLSSDQTNFNRSTSKKLKSKLLDTPPLSRTPSGNPLSHHGHGSTARVDIREHACKWGQKVEARVRIDVVNGNGGAGPPSADSKIGSRERESKEDGKGILGRRNLKIVVYQFLTSSTISSGPTQLGHLDLDLAEYVGKGRTVRRYLLDGGKTNATIKLTIELVQIGGSTNWVQKEISKGQPAGTGLETLVSSAKQNRTNDPDRKIGEVRASIATGPTNNSNPDLGGKEARKPLFYRTKSQQTLTPSDPALPKPPSITFSLSTLASNNKSNTSLSSFHTSPSSSSLQPLSQHAPSPPDSLPKDSSNKPKINLHRALQDRERSTASTESIIESLFNPRPAVLTSAFTYAQPDAGQDDAEEDEPSSAVTGKGVDEYGDTELAGDAGEDRKRKGGGLGVWMRRKRKEDEGPTRTRDSSPSSRPTQGEQPEPAKSMCREEDGHPEGGEEQVGKRASRWRAAEKKGKGKSV